MSVALNAETDTWVTQQIASNLRMISVRHRIISRFFVVLQRRNEWVTDRQTATSCCVKPRRFLR